MLEVDTTLHPDAQHLPLVGVTLVTLATYPCILNVAGVVRARLRRTHSSTASPGEAKPARPGWNPVSFHPRANPSVTHAGANHVPLQSLRVRSGAMCNQMVSAWSPDGRQCRSPQATFRSLRGGVSWGLSRSRIRTPTLRCLGRLRRWGLLTIFSLGTV